MLQVISHERYPLTVAIPIKSGKRTKIQNLTILPGANPRDEDLADDGRNKGRRIIFTEDLWNRAKKMPNIQSRLDEGQLVEKETVGGKS